ncbi:MAG: ABC transporter ATP-binding protein [Phycisphaerales bacterium]|nr:ABC transporter ATP-binding protein [Phycisphaerales bacterium]
MIEVKDIRRRFGSQQVLDGVDFTLEQATLGVLFGPSGCGKSTLLRIIAGLETPDSGSLSIAGRRVAADGVNTIAPEARRVGLVFQDLALFPHLTVARNIEYGLRDSNGRTKRVEEMLSLTRLGHLRDRLPHQLSGGEQQRVAVARALAPRPDLLLLDEPFANLDAELRSTVRTELVELLKGTGTTTIMVTHDREEALSSAEHLLVMSDGRLLQQGPPRTLYESPNSMEAAFLLGDGNLLKGTITSGRATCCLGTIEAAGQPDGPCRIFVRSEHVAIEAADGGPGRVEGGAYYGHDSVASIRFDDGGCIQARLPHGRVPDRGSSVAVRLEGPCTFFAPSTENSD